MNRIKKVLVANRSEIAIRVFRACYELGISTVAIYAREDAGSHHRYKADEAYLVGAGKKPIDAYLDIEGILAIAKEHDVDAIHPGYGFLAENLQFAKRCNEEGIIFIGPNEEHLDMFGDKVKARHQAMKAGIPVIPGTDGPVKNLAEVVHFGEQHGYPFIIKASLGGGGRGMRIVSAPSDAKESYERAKSEAKAAFGSDEVYVEKLIENPKHIEVQILGDQEGNTVHLYERDCSVQRRHQKVVEVAPSMSLPESLRQDICDAAVKLMNNVSYINAGTVEFLVANDEFYFIEVNPRIQVEHTITEMVTGIDIVQSQILIADGYGLKEAGIPEQKNIHINGFAIQSRVTTEDPENNFMPDTGKVTAYRSGGGFGIRLDGGNCFQGAVISPYYDSLLVKLCTWGITFEAAAKKMVRSLHELRVRGVKTNIPFLANVVRHEKFLKGEYDTSFIPATPELFEFPIRQDRGTKALDYIGTVTVNGFPSIGKKKKPIYEVPRIPKWTSDIQTGTKNILDEQGADGLVKWVKEQKKVLLTDTTFRDAHQSLLATRMRTKDMLEIATPTARLMPNLFSLEMWGGATFDVAYRFLKEDPWERLAKLRKEIPNVLFQMLLRGANAVGYTNYPDNVIYEFVEKSAREGIDVFRIFDSLNWLKGMTTAIDAVRKTDKLAEASICYTADLFDPARPKYHLNYYTSLAKELENAGAHILAIKDMAGLLKPQAAYALVSALKDAVDIPIHLHTHDTSGNGVYMYTKAIEAGVDIVDVALSSMAGMTSQPSGNSLYYALEGTERVPDVDIHSLEYMSNYWEDVRHYYKDFESGMNAPHTEIYVHEMPGGQYSNLQQQAKAVGLGDHWDDVKRMYRTVNNMFGDIVKVTPSSKVVGDMALFMVQNKLTENDVYERGNTLDFPASVVEMFEGYLGQPQGGFPEKLQQVILKGREPINVRPGELLAPINFKEKQDELSKLIERKATDLDVLSYVLYPKVFMEYIKVTERFGDVSVFDTPTFLYGMRLGEEVEIVIQKGKTLIIRLVSIGEPKDDGTRTLYFELNGQAREMIVKDDSVQTTVIARIKANRENPTHIGASMPGTVLKVLVKSGEKVAKGAHLMITEAMKMETTVQAPNDGVIKAVHVHATDAIQTGDLLLEFE